MQGAEYEVLDDSQEHWWKVKDENGYMIFCSKQLHKYFTNYFANIFFTINDLIYNKIYSHFYLTHILHSGSNQPAIMKNNQLQHT